MTKEPRAISRDSIFRSLKTKYFVTDFLNKLVKNGYLLHGSKSRLKTIKPWEARNYTYLWGNFKGVYATNEPKIALFYAIKPSGLVDISHYGKGRIKFSATGDAMKNLSGGLVYVLSRRGFVKMTEIDYFCPREVRPLLIIGVEPSDFEPKIHLLEPGGYSNFWCIEEIVKPFMKNEEGIHGLAHSLRAAHFAKMIAKSECPGSLDDTIIGAFLHDIGRTDDSNDRTHASRSAEIAEELLKRHWPDLNHEKILFAIMRHGDGLISEDPIIGTIWDADRLDLSRLGIKINPELISTEKARQILTLMKAANLIQ
jgi:uncharacterized protein